MASTEGGSQESHGSQSNKSTPKDALVMAAILKEMGVMEYEPRVINQMLEFTYRYVTDVLEDARVYSLHADKKNIDLADVKLAVERKLNHSFTAPPPREFLLEVARQKNNQPLPLIAEKSGLRLPPDRYCLTANNYRLKPSAIPQRKSSVSGQRGTGSASSGRLPSSSSGPGRSVHPNLSAATPPPLARANSSGAQARLMSPAMSSPQTHNAQQGRPPSLTHHAPPTSDNVKIKTEPMDTSSTTVTGLPSLEETTASTSSQFPNLLKRRHDDEDDDYDI